MRSRLGISVLLLFSTLGFAVQPDRIPGAIDNGETVVLAGNVPAQAQPQYDQGAVESSFALPYITMLLQPSARQQAALEQLLAQQQDRSSASYHKWLTPEQYADRFGLSPDDTDKIATWLRTQGFSVVQTARGRDWIAFSGTAGLVNTVFRTQIHHYEVDGEMHFANATQLSIPKALDGIVAGFRGLHDFTLKPMGFHAFSGLDKFLADIVHPFYNAGFGHALAPGDVATIYDISPLYTAGTNGTGQKLAVVGQTDIHMTDIEQFRANFGLPANNPQVILIPGSSDPGFSTNDEPEADLDLEWSGAIARNASIIYVNSTNVFDSATYAIDQNLAPVISMSYGGCEQDNDAFIPGNEVTMQKASAEGITFVAASGDSGAAGCDSDQNKSASLGLAVNYPASSPEVTGAGGNEFNGDLSDPSKYWSSSNGTNGGSALSYIAETAWNDTTEDGTLSASGGGASSCSVSGCAHGFPKPSWQTGTGVPNDGVRDVPDIAMAASPDHDGYLFCSADGGANCANGISTSETVGGTSVSTPVFAGIVVLLNQELGNNPPGQGNINQNLYTLAQNTSNGIFHDITTGNNKVPCMKGTKDCPDGGTIGYSAGIGYDQVTGLGSVDVTNLVTEWTGKIRSTIALQVQPSQVNVGVGPVTLTATVTPASGSGTPTGTVTFFNGSTQIGTGPLSDSTPDTATLMYDTSTLPAHVYSMTASYGGDSNFTSSNSTAEPLTVGTPTTTTLMVSPATVTVGASVSFTATVTSGNGAPPDGETVTFTDNNTGTQLGSAPLSKGSAGFSSSKLLGATYQVVASYAGDANFANSSSAAQQLNVQDFSLTPSTANVTVSAPGQSGSAQLTLTPLGNFSSAITFSCSSTLPSEASCVFNPATVTPNGAAVPVTLTIITTAPTSTQLRAPFSRGGVLYALLIPGLFVVAVFPQGNRKRALGGVRLLGLLAFLTCSALWMGACGGGSSSGSGGGGGNTNPGTPAGTSTVTVTASSSGANALTRTMTVTLTVQ